MKILLFGANGQVGQALARVLEPCHQLRALTRQHVDLADHQAIIAAIQAYQPDCIINAAAYTSVDAAQSHVDLAFAINNEAVRIMAKQAKHCSALLVHYSTDYVFNGKQQRPYQEEDPCDPINIYGQSKLAGEKAIAAALCNHLILRVSWVIAAHGNNFAKTMLRLAQQREQLTVIHDQFGVPTTADFIASITRKAIETQQDKPWPSGIYNLVPQGRTNWYEMAQLLLDCAAQCDFPLQVTRENLLPIGADQYPAVAPRPQYSLLDTRKLRAQLEHDLPFWQQPYVKTVKEIIHAMKRQS